MSISIARNVWRACSIGWRWLGRLTNQRRPSRASSARKLMRWLTTRSMLAGGGRLQRRSGAPALVTHQPAVLDRDDTMGIGQQAGIVRHHKDAAIAIRGDRT